MNREGMGSTSFANRKGDSSGKTKHGATVEQAANFSPPALDPITMPRAEFCFVQCQPRVDRSDGLVLLAEALENDLFGGGRIHGDAARRTGNGLNKKPV